MVRSDSGTSPTARSDGVKPFDGGSAREECAGSGSSGKEVGG
jgi:hypothetical protein